MAGFRERDNEPLGSIIHKEFLYYLSDYQLPKTDPAPRISLKSVLPPQKIIRYKGDSVPSEMYNGYENILTVHNSILYSTKALTLRNIKAGLMS